jgi:alkylhydroperoxidase family enzyme
MTAAGFLDMPAVTADAQHHFDEDVAELGFVMNATRLWAYAPATMDGLFDLIKQTSRAHDLTVRQRGILVLACASAFGDSYCSLAWGSRLAAAADVSTAAGVLRGSDDGLTTSERAMAGWARTVGRDPHSTRVADVQALRDAGFGDAQIFGITVFVALRIAFSTVNDALGVRPDAEFRSAAPAAVLDAVTYGRPISDETAG